MIAAALDAVCRQMGLKDFASLAAKGTVDIWPEPVLQFADLHVPDAERQDRDLERGR